MYPADNTAAVSYRQMRKTNSIAHLIVIISLFMCATFCALGTTIDFENLDTSGSGKPVKVTDQYQAEGVYFNGPYIVDYSSEEMLPRFASSGTKAVEQLCSNGDCFASIDMNFTKAQQMVEVRFGVSMPLNENRTVTLIAFGPEGRMIGKSSLFISPSNYPRRIRMPLEILADGPDITSAQILFWPADGRSKISTKGLAIDDIKFEDLVPGAFCHSSRQPSVTIISPDDRSSTPGGRLDINGLIDVESPLIDATLTATASDGKMKAYDLISNHSVDVEGGAFSAHVDGFLFAGQNNVTVTATDCNGTRSRSITLNQRLMDIPSAGAACTLFAVLSSWIWRSRRRSKF